MAEQNRIYTPQYKKLYELLRRHIYNGVYKPGDLLPSENELCITHNLTRPTVRQALQELVNDGYIKKQQGKGSIVSPLPKGIGILSLAGFTSAVGEKNVQTKIIVKPRIIKWEDSFMFELPEDIKEVGCIYMERLRLINEIPRSYDINYIPNINLPRFTSRNFENKSLFDILRKNYKIKVSGGEQKIRAIAADDRISKYLQVKKGHPVLHLERKLDTNRVGFCFFSSFYCNTESDAIYGTF
jgi:DNA-binding GntR family transcriptional regulator